ncbi:MAG TPA: insulinase family protein [Thermoanaerobaculia bacterium]|jgi:zinc protease|nr:insulinase family protein [Thermoanaerobaculia bacterium]
MKPRHARLFLLITLAVLSAPAAAQDLRPQVERLANGLTVMILEDHAQPLVSVQMLYRVGGRTENAGETGLAHFVEHMAFRATENFPDTQVVSRIYAAGGEWHGYTWIDETTYFETLPADKVDLAIAIEADRMARLQIPAGEIEAERGAVLTELRDDENDPASRLNDEVVATSFLEHPYRNNVIGWESDVRQLTRDQIAAFYHAHYVPPNAVLAVAGDVEPARLMALIHRSFDAIPPGVRTPLPRAVEPPQLGERRVDLHGGGGRSWFQISYRAPAANDPDWPAFLLLQAVLSGSPGVNFRQDEPPFPARPGTRLDGVRGVETIKTFFEPTALPYVFSVSGNLSGTTEPAAIEAEIEQRIAALREHPDHPNHPISAAEIAAAKRGLLDALHLDAETTEDAAHQMAFFEGIGAFEILRRLPELVSAVTPEDLQRVAASRLQPWQRTIGWMRPDAPVAVPAIPVLAAPPPGPRAEPPHAAEPPHVNATVRKLRNGVALIVRRLPRIPAGVLRVVVPSDTAAFGDGSFEVTPDEPVWRHTSLDIPFRAGELAQAVEQARQALAAAKPAPAPAVPDDPEARVRLALRDLLGVSPTPLSSPAPVVIAAVGDLDEAAALRLLEAAFGTLPAPRPLPPAPLQVTQTAVTIHLSGLAQAQLGYAVPAAGTSAREADAWRILLYIMSHGYEGRLGKELIGHLGLLYYIDSRYDSDGRTGWISLVTGVNPDQLAAARDRFAELLGRLRQEPPTGAEIDEAKQSLIGRRITAPMSNAEITAAYAREWIEQGRLLTDAEFAQRVRAVTRAQVLALVPRFLAGGRVVVE